MSEMEDSGLKLLIENNLLGLQGLRTLVNGIRAAKGDTSTLAAFIADPELQEKVGRYLVREVKKKERAKAAQEKRAARKAPTVPKKKKKPQPIR
ncbi:hypothetical protein HN958_02615 [Candidatus Falkowbacteria bacterium]|jgi:hypothetical protein|nr:hypothetical protein [Candidatus Falkowbacteria bacterium]